ncbi:MAG: hypothetical protein RHS_3020 [Robinsoniella sp. RHS]|nr:MAG: hypothetical protein RHS_3020 [Robinsoniella sp. RHS]
MPVSHTHLSEIQVAATKLNFSAWSDPWAVTGCSLLDVERYILTVYA